MSKDNVVHGKSYLLKMHHRAKHQRIPREVATLKARSISRDTFGLHCPVTHEIQDTYLILVALNS